jgi:hypothetical protein
VERTVGARIAAIARKEAAPPRGTACGGNKAGGTGYFTSCNGNNGEPEFWCADFAKWVWQQAGVLNVDVLSAAAASFGQYGPVRHDNPEVGDAILFNYSRERDFADHVAIVVQVNPGGTIVSIGGDEQGRGHGIDFAGTSGVFADGPYQSAAGSTPPTIGLTISGYVSPVEDDMPYTQKEILDLVKQGVAAELSAGSTKHEILALIKQGVAAELNADIGTSGISPAQGARAAVHAQNALAGIGQQLTELTAMVHALQQTPPAAPVVTGTAPHATGTAPVTGTAPPVAG